MELEAIIKKLNDQDTRNEGFVELRDYDAARGAVIEDTKKQLSEALEKIAALRDTNQRLYLRVTEAPEGTDTEEDEPSDFEKLIKIKGDEKE
jgi:hypothetical protein